MRPSSTTVVTKKERLGGPPGPGPVQKQQRFTTRLKARLLADPGTVPGMRECGITRHSGLRGCDFTDGETAPLSFWGRQYISAAQFRTGRGREHSVDGVYGAGLRAENSNMVADEPII